MLNSPGFAEEFDQDSDTKSGKFGIASSFADLVKSSRKQSYGALRPSDVKYAVSGKSSIFRGYGQQDAHEFLVHFLEGASIDLNKVSAKPKYMELDYQPNRSRQENVGVAKEGRRLVQLLQEL